MVATGGRKGRRRDAGLSLELSRVVSRLRALRARHRAADGARRRDAGGDGGVVGSELRRLLELAVTESAQLLEEVTQSAVEVHVTDLQ